MGGITSNPLTPAQLDVLVCVPDGSRNGVHNGHITSATEILSLDTPPLPDGRALGAGLWPARGHQGATAQLCGGRPWAHCVALPHTYCTSPPPDRKGLPVTRSVGLERHGT